MSGILLAFWYKQAIRFATNSISAKREPRCQTNPCGISDQKKKKKRRKEVKSGKERQTSLRILFFSSSSKSGKGKMERIKRAAEKRRAWLEVSTNNVYFIHPSLLTPRFPRNLYLFRTCPQWPISKVDRKRGRAALSFFLRGKSPLVYLFIVVVGANESKGRRWQTLKLHFH